MDTLNELKLAIDELKKIEERNSNYSGNNPNKYDASIRDARIKVRILDAKAKSEGLIELNNSEKLNRILDEKYPNAKSKKIVEYEGAKYIKRYFPVVKSRSRKTVREWGSSWNRLDDE
ncbi:MULTISPECIES: hypothetical protein [Providencia]|uniref:hypothetical protein n=1 Tax=Providencia TaxID=586 RepID=UPI0008FB6C05|nr:MULTISPECIES: hypothetical protein [Providencia]APC11832.1 hypothetical protein RB151_021600 [Providencia rettgeri]AVL75163.1 hypothetical protein CEQ08_16205 [Providencia rettgeri]EKH6494962.1 hypothetical protein [Providencia rettgeri]ELR5051721.1 hypothetical protein [Providencia rettgeri]ELR5153624.1 hypothetical protein [Providencia rettgeri]